MSLKDLLAQNPAANIEYENALKESEKAGYQKGKADMIEISSKAAVFASSKEYPEQIKAIAIEVMQGKKSQESLEVLAAAFDMNNEKKKSDEAKGEQKEGCTGQQEPAADDESKFKAEVARTREALGLGVN